MNEIEMHRRVEELFRKVTICFRTENNSQVIGLALSHVLVAITKLQEEPEKAMEEIINLLRNGVKIDS